VNAPLFNLGVVVLTPGALEAAQRIQASLAVLVDLHVRGDWSELDEHDQEVNRQAVAHNGRVMAQYTVDGVRFWIITEHDRSVTTVLLPEEY